MASNYEVNIKLNTRTVNKQLNNLEKRISKLNKLAQGGRANRTVLRNEQEKIKKTGQRLGLENKILRQKKEQLKVDQQQLKVLQQAGNTRTNQASGGGRAGGGGGGFRNAVSSAAISGAFPLLFGQGPAAAAGGFSGGLIGTALGGQMGGFAGGLIGTTVVTTFQQQVLGLSKALDPLNADIDTLIERLGRLSSARKKEIKIIEQFRGKQAALEEITKDLVDVIGEDGVAAFRKLRESAKLFTDKFIDFALKLSAKAAEMTNKTKEFINPGGFDLAKAQSGLESVNDATIKDLNRELEALRKELENLPGINTIEAVSFGLIGGDNARKKVRDQNVVKGKIEDVKDEIKLNAAKKAGSIIDKQASAAIGNQKLATKLELEDQQRLNDIRREGRFIMSKGLAEELLALDKLNDDRLKIFNRERDIAQEVINQLEGVENLSNEDKLRLERANATVTSIDAQVEANERNFKALRKSTLEARKLQNAANETVDAFEKFNATIQNDIKQGLKGLIKGTSTLGDMLNNIADRFLDLALTQALFGNAGGKTVTGGLFKLFGFADGGRPPVGRASVVGEKGPELFVPDRPGTIIPNHGMGETNISVSVDASGSSVEGNEQNGEELGRLMAAAIQSELIKEKRPGGLLS